MDATDRRMKRLARLAWACAALVLAITTLSAFIRLSRGGPGCEPWPQCAAQSISAEAAPGVTQARITHRVAASAALLLVIVLLVQCHTGTPALPGPGRLAAALLALGVFLAVLGRMAGDSRAAPVVMANLLAGFAMFALACRLALALRPPARAVTPASRAAPRLAMLALLLLGLQVALGAAVGPTACEGSLACSTCHVIIDSEWYDALPAASTDEEDMLDLAFGLTKTSRLGCQIIVSDEIDGLVVSLPKSRHG